MKKLIQLIILTAAMLPCLAFAQTIVKGTVNDSNGALPGVSIREKGTDGNGTVTDAKGQFQLRLKGTSNVLVFSFISYVTQEVSVAGKTSITVTLKEDSKDLNEVIVVGYGTTKKITNTGAVSSISASEIRNTPTPNIQNTLAGRVPGFISQQRSGQPGQTGADFYIRGVNSLNAASQQPLIIVDDVEYTYDQVAQLDANEIETFTILKDASTTAIYGIKGANGVLVITTRRGKIGRPQVNLLTQNGLQSAVNIPKFLRAYDVALLRNEADRNDGLAAEFSDADLEHWRLGDDPYGHPDVDWYNTIFRKYAYQNTNNVNISGGNEKIKYFVSLGNVAQSGALRNFAAGNDNAPDNNYSYTRYNFRSNLDMQATKDLTLRLDITGRLGTATEPHIATAPLSTIYSYQRFPPYASPIYNPNGSYPYAFRSRMLETSIVGRLALQGYDRTYRNEFNILFNVNHKLDFLTKGLSVNGHVAYSSDATYDRSLSRDNIPSFYYNPANGTYTPASNGLYALPPLTLSSDIANTKSLKTTNTLANLSYDRSFGGHHVYGLLLYSFNSVANAVAGVEPGPVTTTGGTLRVGYDYKRRYLIEFDGANNGTNRFVGSQRHGLFPALSVGWNIAEEPFFKKNVEFMDLFKLRGSYGITGSDIAPITPSTSGKYLTEQVYTTGTSYNFGETSNTATSIQEGGLGNANITWEKSRKLDVGFDAQFFNGKLNVTIDYFYDRRYDQLITRTDILNILGVPPAVTNSAITENKGFDGQVGYNNHVGGLTYSTSFTFSIARNKVLYNGIPSPRYEWLSRVGKPIGQALGYNALGFFQTQAEVDGYAHLTGAQPGDLKLEDLNNDGVIDAQDIRGIGQSNLPQTVLGTTLGLSYKGFSFNILFQGSFDYSYHIATQSVVPFQTNLQEFILNRWTPETASTALYPRLSTNLSGPSTPSNNSSYWQIPAHYIRLKSLDFGYSFPKKWIDRFKMSNAKIFVSGYDIITWSNFSMYPQDPEIKDGGSGGTYPVQKIYNVSLQIGF